MKLLLPSLGAACLFWAAVTPVQASTKLVITPDMIINESGLGDASLLVDEQAQAGDPRAGAGGGCWSAWTGGWDSSYYPCYAIIDLKVPHHITQIYIFDRGQSPNNMNTMEFSAGAPLNWTSLFTDTLPNNDVWNAHTVDVTTRYLRVTLRGHGQYWFPTEIVVYGDSTGQAPEPTPTPTYQTQRPVRDLIGTNTFLEDPPGRQMVAGHLREYHPWSWSEYYQDQNAWGPSYAAGGGWNFDIFYDKMKKLGITTAPVLMQNAPYLPGGQNAKPVPTGQDSYDPHSYLAHATHLWQFAARFGATAHADNELKLATGQPRVSGLDTVKFYENWNEQDATWSGAAALFHPFEYAAMASADYDGHQNTMGAGVGVKNADPNAKLVMGGIANGNAGVDYLRMMKFWADANRGGSVPFDVINVHFYSNTSGVQNSGTGTYGISPELDDLRGKVAKITDYRNRYMPGKEVWVSEFGYDVNANSIQRAPAIPPFSAEEVQAQWLVRSYLAMTAGGVDRAQQFMLRDDDANSTTTYASSGMVSSKATGFLPKISWYYVYTLKNRLGRYTYAGDVATGNANVLAYKFAEGGVVKGYAVWCKTSNNTTVSNFQLTLDGTPATATLVQLATTNVNGTESNLPITAGKVTFNVSERPVFVLLDNNDPDFELDQKIPINPSMVTNESLIGDAGLIADEQAKVGDPFNGNGGTAADVNTYWDTTYGAFPASVYLDLGAEKYITALCFMDMHGIGDLKVSIGSPGNWTEVATQPTQGYESWGTIILKKTTRYLRLTRMSQGAAFNEVVLYGRSQAPPDDGSQAEVWTNVDIGSPGVAGSGATGSMFTVTGAGAHIWQDTDQFHFLYMPATGNCEIKARALSHPYLHYSGKAGIMIREKLTTGSSHVFLGMQPGGSLSEMVTNVEGNGWSGWAQSVGLVPYWIKLTRVGNVLTGYVSSDNSNWTQVAQQTISMAANVYVGFAVCSGSNEWPNTATFDNVTVTP